ncbi:MAG: restriction endonuclease subunit S [Methylovulum sp.]|uniref:restriction endonuclease subunit S n=1 Tax=Methylovulum sp. TaxID=1916980 RepID=UPI0026180538|nr:restriction endonuclease subunit S [Methylovulum sp.]MDD2722993.1 restriction endonuclease subunit S [Methylovulum sp.]
MNVPRLRFKEFSGNWEVKKLGDIATFSKGKGISKADIDKNGKTFCIRYGELYTEYGETIHYVKSKTNIHVDNLVLSEINDVIIPASGETQIDIATASCVQVAGIALGSDLNIIKSQENGVFLSYYLNNQKKLDIAKLAQGNSVVHLYSSQLKSLDLNIPDRNEQTKIANFLTAVDEKIARLTQKGELLARYKKGVMQQIFSQQLRFKDDDGRDFPDWEEKSLGDLTQIYDGTHMTPNYTKSGIPFYSVEHITNNNFKDTKFISRDVFERENKRVRLEKGDILMTKIGDIGTPKYIDWDVEASFYVSLALIKKSNKASSLYLAHFIRTRFFQNELHKRIIHVAFPKKINLGEISNCMVNLPCQKEQTKIANFLTALDDKISHNQTQLDAVKQYKQGLLQQLFV